MRNRSITKGSFINKFVFVALFLAIGFSVLAFSSYKAIGPWRIIDAVGAPEARHENAFVEAGGSLYLLGGRGVRKIAIFNPSDSTWTDGPHTPDFISLHHFQAGVIGDTIYVLASYTGTFPDETAVENIYKYDTVSDEWIVGPEIPISRRRAAAGVAVYDGKFYVVCGSTGGHGDFSVRLAYFDQYDPATDTWTPMPDAPRVRDHVHAAVVGDKLYVTAGRDGNVTDNIEEVDVFDFTTNQWSTLPASSGNIPTPRGGAASLTIGKYVVVIGGESVQDLAHNEVEALNTETDSWISLDPLVVGRHGTQAAFLDDKIYVTAGAGMKGGSPELTSIEVFDTMGEATLPVELDSEINTLVDGQSVEISWTTLSETNNAGFEVQHWIGDGFIGVGFVEGHGTSLMTHHYSFTVSNLSPGRHLFRLKQLDFDGSFEMSPEITAFIDTPAGFHVGSIYPNPLNPEARFELSLQREQHVQIDVYNVAGQHMLQLQNGRLDPFNVYSFKVNGSQLSSGKYILFVRGEFFTTSQPFTVLK